MEKKRKELSFATEYQHSDKRNMTVSTYSCFHAIIAECLHSEFSFCQILLCVLCIWSVMCKTFFIRIGTYFYVSRETRHARN